MITITHEASVTRLMIIDQQGSVVQTREVIGAESTTLNVSGLASGAYRLVMQHPNGLISQPLMVVR